VAKTNFKEYIIISFMLEKHFSLLSEYKICVYYNSSITVRKQFMSYIHNQLLNIYVF